MLYLLCTKLLVAQVANLIFKFNIYIWEWKQLSFWLYIVYLIVAVFSLFEYHIFRVNNAMRKCKYTVNSKIKRVRSGHLCKYIPNDQILNVLHNLGALLFTWYCINNCIDCKTCYFLFQPPSWELIKTEIHLRKS